MSTPGKNPSKLDCSGDPGKTRQEFKEETDINVIMRKYAKTGQLPQLIKQNPSYGDYTSVQSYQEAVEVAQSAQEKFRHLPVNLRTRFQNDPAKFLEWIDNDANLHEASKYGLLNETGLSRLEGILEAERKKSERPGDDKPATKPQGSGS